MGSTGGIHHASGRRHPDHSGDVQARHSPLSGRGLLTKAFQGLGLVGSSSAPQLPQQQKRSGSASGVQGHRSRHQSRIDGRHGDGKPRTPSSATAQPKPKHVGASRQKPPLPLCGASRPTHRSRTNGQGGDATTAQQPSVHDGGHHGHTSYYGSGDVSGAGGIGASGGGDDPRKPRRNTGEDPSHNIDDLTGASDDEIQAATPKPPRKKRRTKEETLRSAEPDETLEETRKRLRRENNRKTSLTYCRKKAKIIHSARKKLENGQLLTPEEASVIGKYNSRLKNPPSYLSRQRTTNISSSAGESSYQPPVPTHNPNIPIARALDPDTRKHLDDLEQALGNGGHGDRSSSAVRSHHPSHQALPPGHQPPHPRQGQLPPHPSAGESSHQPPVPTHDPNIPIALARDADTQENIRNLEELLRNNGNGAAGSSSKHPRHPPSR